MQSSVLSPRLLTLVISKVNSYLAMIMLMSTTGMRPRPVSLTRGMQSPWQLALVNSYLALIMLISTTGMRLGLKRKRFFHFREKRK
jgi:hypothetical protein